MVSSCSRQAMTASIFKSSATDRSESRPRWRGLVTLLACPLPSLAAERCCAARAPRVTMGRVRRLASGVPKHIGPEVIGCAGCPDEKPSARHSTQPTAAQPQECPRRESIEPRNEFLVLSGPDCKAIIGLYGPWFIAVSSKQAAWLADATNSTFNRGGQIAMRPRFSPVGWPGAPASSSVSSQLPRKGLAPPAPLSNVKLPSQTWPSRRSVSCRSVAAPEGHEHVEIGCSCHTVTAAILHRRPHRLLRR